ncbi:MAG: hypothetical protein CSA75_03395 [Sorangium cellulosum]|nr:MAG: hypothetical protein CSA75_03395 [Sorangium cellulosum]
MDVGSTPLGNNALGHADLADNAWSWVFDWYHEAWYAGSGNSRNNCAKMTNSSFKVTRGGSLANVVTSLRAAFRDGIDPTIRAGLLGFRCARTPSL